MEILKNIVLALHIIGVASLLGGVLVQIPAMRTGKARVIPAILHGAWVMLATGLLLVGLQYPLGHSVDNAKIAVKLVILIAILVIALVYRKRSTLASWVLPVLGVLTVANIVIATVWKPYTEPRRPGRVSARPVARRPSRSRRCRPRAPAARTRAAPRSSAPTTPPRRPRSRP